MSLASQTGSICFHFATKQFANLTDFWAGDQEYDQAKIPYSIGSIPICTGNDGLGGGETVVARVHVNAALRLQRWLGMQKRLYIVDAIKLWASKVRLQTRWFVSRCQTPERIGSHIILSLSCSVLRLQIWLFLFSNALFAGICFLEGSALVGMMDGSRGQESFSLVSADAFVLLSVHTYPSLCIHTWASYCRLYRSNRTAAAAVLCHIVIGAFLVGVSLHSHLAKHPMFTHHTSQTTTLNQQLIEMDWATFNIWWPRLSPQEWWLLWLPLSEPCLHLQQISWKTSTFWFWLCTSSSTASLNSWSMQLDH